MTGLSIVATNHLQPFPRIGQWQAGRVADDESAAFDCGKALPCSFSSLGF